MSRNHGEESEICIGIRTGSFVPAPAGPARRPRTCIHPVHRGRSREGGGAPAVRLCVLNLAI
jgi:hypothetical protein